MRTSYVSKNAEEREEKKRKEAAKRRQQSYIKKNLSDTFTELKSQSEANVQNKPKKKGKKWLIFVVVILIISVGCGAYFLTRPKDGVPAESTQTEESTDTQIEDDGGM